ncbi:MAG: rod shape-determining protein MreC [Solirubrobacterales bacterium]
MYRKQVRRRRAVLVGLVLACLVLLSTFISEGEGGPLHSAQRGVSAVLGPVEEASARALKPARDFVGWFDETFDARGENGALKAEVIELRDELADAESAVGENRELRRLTGLDPATELGGRDPVTARVIARNPTVWYSSVTLNQGTGSGVRVDDPVITGEGLIGRVSEVTPNTANVTLVTDHRSAVTARVLPDGPSGIVKSEVGDPDDLELDFIEDDAEVREGQTLVTAGWSSNEISSRFPPGLLIGEVVEAKIGEQEIFKTVTVRPFADLAELDFVQILTRKGDS